MELKAFLESRYPELENNIYGENYPPAFFRVIIANLCSLLYFGGILLIMGGDTIFSALRIPHPLFYTKIKENRGAVLILIFLLNSYGSGLLATGAFEIIIDGASLNQYPTARNLKHLSR